MNALSTFWEAIYSVWFLHNVDFRKSFEKQDFEHVEAPAASMDLVITGHSYNIRVVRNSEFSNHDLFSFVDMKGMSKLCMRSYGLERTQTSTAARCSLNRATG